MVTLVLGDLSQLQTLAAQAQATVYGGYKRYTLCHNPLGFYLVAPNRDILTFLDQAVYTPTVEEAQQLIDWQLASRPKRSASPSSSRSSAKTSTANRRSSRARATPQRPRARPE